MPRARRAVAAVDRVKFTCDACGNVREYPAHIKAGTHCGVWKGRPPAERPCGHEIPELDCDGCWVPIGCPGRMWPEASGFGEDEDDQGGDTKDADAEAEGDPSEEAGPEAGLAHDLDHPFPVHKHP